MSLLASIVAAAQDVNVKIVDDGRGGLSLRDLVIPLGALIAGIGGVLIGGLIQHGIERKRGDREDRLDERRAQRERELEDARQRNAANASKRQAIGSIRIALDYLFDVHFVSAEALQERSAAPFRIVMKSPIEQEDRQLLASWLGSGAWNAFIGASGWFKHFKDLDDEDAELSPKMLGNIEALHTSCAEAMRSLATEEIRLASEIGDPEPRHFAVPEYDWPPIEDTGG